MSLVPFSRMAHLSSLSAHDALPIRSAGPPQNLVDTVSLTLTVLNTGEVYFVGSESHFEGR